MVTLTDGRNSLIGSGSKCIHHLEIIRSLLLSWKSKSKSKRGYVVVVVVVVVGSSSDQKEMSQKFCVYVYVDFFFLQSYNVPIEFFFISSQFLVFSINIMQYSVNYENPKIPVVSQVYVYSANYS